MKSNHIIEELTNMSNCLPAAHIRAANLSAPYGIHEVDKSTNYDKHSITKFSYNYGTEEELISDTPLFKLQIAQGRIVEYTYPKHKLRLKLILKDKADINGLTELSKGFAHVVEKYKHKFGIRSFNVQNPANLQGAFKYPYDPMTGDSIENAPPWMDLKIDYRSIFQMPKLSSGGKIEYRTIKPQQLVGKNMICSVIIQPNHLIKFDEMPHPQIYVRSCIVLNIKQIEVEHTLDENIREYLMQNQERVELMNNIIAKEEPKEENSLKLDVPSEEKLNPIPIIPPQQVFTLPNLLNDSTRAIPIDLNQYLNKL